MSWDENTAYENGMIWLPKSGFSVRQLKGALTFVYGSADYNSARAFYLYKERKDHIGVPRHFLKRDTITGMGVPIVDLRPERYDEVDIYSSIQLDKLRPEETIQTDAVEAAFRAEDGIISLACGNGKTLIGLHIWAHHRVPIVIMADNTSLLEQWAKQIRLWISPHDLPIGRVYGKQKNKNEQWNCPVVLASVQSLFKHADDLPDEVRRKFGMVIVDEIHKIAAPVYNRIAPIFMGYRLGLSATPTRTDRLEPVYQYHFGPVVYQNLSQPLKPKFFFYTPSSSKDLTDDPSFRRRTLLWGEVNMQKLWTALAEEEKRTYEIASLIKRLGQGRRVLVMSQRKSLLWDLQKLLPEAGVVVNETPLDQRAEIISRKPVVLGIMKIVKEGIDSDTLDMLIVCEPFKDENLFQQVVGRILRESPGKTEPAVIIITDDVGKVGGPVYGLARCMKRTINNWPPSKGGPYSFDVLTP